MLLIQNLGIDEIVIGTTSLHSAYYIQGVLALWDFWDLEKFALAKICVRRESKGEFLANVIFGYSI